MDKNLIIRKIDFMIEHLFYNYSYKNGKLIQTIEKIRTRIIDNKKLDKKMKEIIKWIDKSVTQK